ncbi:dol-P-Glc:Glc(2)Man(9)GlcNAc(2)-PP-Dol alpha-1,2-glucosyltransferase isoform X4 [Accipiter gentilis]|uniref:dol-P-Glc:Glc(2)Man(9)GlcNAc(2)-PP-Dol alpha-1,2-glucosyltransferase isoform X4 n=1 Tax=Astur gentilis TaxID=8957 RepID=UPI00210FE037|nr:dol-P-Glc:Glc(2)Man(9)GlcNAc(2)-PP-Dol alpha-1,2-glucosyltransferase isoform X4 [Accipiter gentilis]
MERSEAYGFSAAMSGAFLLSCLLFAAINRRQRGPYMDEAFHVPQAQAYCHGRFLQWDPMITTLPGLYLASVGVVKPAARLFGWTGSVVCSVGMLRFINLLFSAGNFYLLYLLLLKIHLKNKYADQCPGSDPFPVLTLGRVWLTQILLSNVFATLFLLRKP